MAEFDLAASFIPSLHKPASLLPIARHRQSLLYLIETYPVTIVVGQTGSGKTTQIPQYLEQAGWCSDGKIIAVTQVSSSSRLDRVLVLTIFSPVESPRLLLLSELQKSLDAKSAKKLAIRSDLKMSLHLLLVSNSSLMVYCSVRLSSILCSHGTP